jgi:hypothetical protein
MKTVRNGLYFRLLDEAEAKMKAGIQTNSYVEELLKNSEELGMDRSEIGFVRVPSSLTSADFPV